MHTIKGMIHNHPLFTTNIVNISAFSITMADINDILQGGVFVSLIIYNFYKIRKEKK